MSAKNRDEHNRWRNITVGFRVSPAENEQLNVAVALSGLPKQEYCYRRCMNRDIVASAGEMREELFENITLITKTLNEMKEEPNETKK